jgi:hypothetical protein
MNGKGITEIDAEKYETPFLERFTYYSDAWRYGHILVFERGSKHDSAAVGQEIFSGFGKVHRASVLIENKHGKGKGIYLNLSPLEYGDPKNRFNAYGRQWREVVGSILANARLTPRVRVYENDIGDNMIEALFWKNGEKRYLGIVKNPSNEKELARLGEEGKVSGITGNPLSIVLAFKDVVRLIDLRKNQDYGKGSRFTVPFNPWEGNLYEVVMGSPQK